MAIVMNSDCNICVHKGVCKYEGNAKADFEKLKKMRYGRGPNDDFDWQTMSLHRNVKITFECIHYKDEQKEQKLPRR